MTNSPTEPQALLQVPLSEERGGPLTFLNKKDLFEWLQNEVDFWKWLFDIPAIKDSTLQNDTMGIRAILDRYKRILANAGVDGASIDVIEADAAIKQIDAERFMHSACLDAQAIKAINDTDGAWAACNALAFQRNTTFNFNRRKPIVGLLKYFLFKEGINPHASQAVTAH